MRRSLELGTRRRAARLVGVLFVFICLSAALAAPNGSAAPVWSSPASVDPSFSAAQYACASSTLCIVIGKSSTGTQQLSVYNGSSWSALTSAATATGDTSVLLALACAPGTTFCTATDAGGNSVSYDNGSWGSPTPTGLDDPNALSCPTASFCLAIGTSVTDGPLPADATFNGTSWTSESAVPIVDADVPSLSCATSTLCIATGGSLASVYDGSSWHSSSLIDVTTNQNDSLSGVSCAVGTDTCVAIDTSGNAYAYNSSTGVVSQSIADGLPLTSVSCVPGNGSAIECVALDPYGDAYSTHAPTTTGSWNSGVYDDLTQGTSALVSCSSDADCSAVDEVAYSSAADGPTAATWSGGAGLGSGGLSAVSCAPDTSDCVATDFTGHIVVSTGSSTSAPANVATNTPLTTIACPSADECLAGDYDGNVLSVTPTGTPGVTQLDSTTGLAAISCPTTSFCDALADDGNIYSYNGSNWSKATNIDSAANGPNAISCASASFCVVTDYAGNAFTYNGTSWSAAKNIDAAKNGLNSVSCPTSSLCFAGDEAGSLFDDNAGTWGNAYGPGDGAISAVACTSPQFCSVATSSGIFYDASTFPIQTPTAYTPDPWQQLSTDADVTDIGCSSSAYCLAVDTNGDEVTFSGPPANTVAPTVTGTAAQGTTLTASTGSWVGSPSSYQYQWFECSANSSGCDPISGATSQTYAIPEVTYSESFQVNVTAVNAYGASEPASSEATNTAAVLLPANATLPAIHGTAAVGKKLTASTGTWSGAGTLAYSYQWYLCARTCTAVAKATSATLKVTAADIGRSLAVIVHATNIAGASEPAVSKATAVIAAPAATLASWLSPLLHLTGSGGHLTKIKRAKDYRATFRAAIPGTVKVIWTVTEKLAHTKRNRAVTIASVTTKTKAPSTPVKVRLSKVGTAVLKRLRREKVKVTATFTYAFGTSTRSFRATRTLTLAH